MQEVLQSVRRRLAKGSWQGGSRCRCSPDQCLPSIWHWVCWCMLCYGLRRFSLWCIYNIRRKKRRERRNPDDIYLNIQTSCSHNLRLKCFQKWIGQGMDTRVKWRSQISRQMINQSTTNRLGTGDCIKVMLLQGMPQVACPQIGKVRRQ